MRTRGRKNKVKTDDGRRTKNDQVNPSVLPVCDVKKLK